MLLFSLGIWKSSKNQSRREARGHNFLCIPRPKPCITQGRNNWPAWLQGLAWDSCLIQGWLTLCEALLACFRKQYPELDFVCQCFSFCPRNISSESGVEPELFFTIKSLPLPRNSQPKQASFICCFSESFCAPPWRASFPSLSKLNSLMVILIISICCCSQLPLDL